jgi:uncharacterized protein YecE (DUF72 family)
MTPTQDSLFAPPRRSTPLRVGPAGWNYKDWENIVYGRGVDPLAFLADYVDMIEINSSFYAPPRTGDAASWARRVAHNRNFRFTAKAWQRISHQRRPEEPAALEADCDAVRRSLAPLAEAGILGALLVQFPWSFRHTPENMEYLDRVFRRLADFPLVVEVRHAGWDTDSFYDFLRIHNVGFCNIDQPVIGQSLRPDDRVTAPPGYIRLHGRNYADWFREGAGRDARYNYLYSREEIRQLSGSIRKMGQTTEEPYAVTNNHFRGQALVNALEIVEELGGAAPAVPPLLKAAYPGRFRET